MSTLTAKTTIYLDPSVKRFVRHKAVSEDRSLSDIINQELTKVRNAAASRQTSAAAAKTAPLNKTKKAKNGIKFGVWANEKNLRYSDEALMGIDPDIQEMFYGKDWNRQ